MVKSSIGCLCDAGCDQARDVCLKPLMVYLMILAVLDMVHRSERTGYDAVVMDRILDAVASTVAADPWL
jgi:hypothetical protein